MKKNDSWNGKYYSLAVLERPDGTHTYVVAKDKQGFDFYDSKGNLLAHEQREYTDVEVVFYGGRCFLRVEAYHQYLYDVLGRELYRHSPKRNIKTMYAIWTADNELGTGSEKAYCETKELAEFETHFYRGAWDTKPEIRTISVIADFPDFDSEESR